MFTGLWNCRAIYKRKTSTDYKGKRFKRLIGEEWWGQEASLISLINV